MMRVWRHTPGLGPLARVAAMLCVGPALAHAQQAAFDPGLEAERERDLQERRQAVEEFTPRTQASAPRANQPAVGPCFDINRITVTGITALSAQDLGRIIARYVPGCLKGADVQAVMLDIDGAYAEAGHITTKTYIPPQNIADGVLELNVVEGTTEGVFLVDENGLVETATGRRQLATAFPGVKNRVFQLRDYEQGLDQMNRLKSVEAKLRLQPGAEPGGSNVIVQRIQKDRFRGYATWDNQGSEATGQNQLRFDAEFDDFLGLNDFWTLGLSSSENTNALSTSASFPIGYWTLNAGWSYSEYLTPLTQIAELFGTTRTSNLSLSRLVHRNQNTLTTLSFGLQVRESERFINNARLTPQNLSVLELGLRHIRSNGPVRNSFDASLKFGLDAFGATKDISGVSSDVPHAQFTKLEGGWYRQGPLGKGVLVNDLRVQYAPVALFSAEQMALGSYSTVRGYELSQAIGDMGAYIRNDLYLAPEWLGLDKTKSKLLREIRHQVFLDAGITFDHARDTSEEVASIGYGLTWKRGRAELEAMVAAPLVDQGSLNAGEPIAWFKLKLKAF